MVWYKTYRVVFQTVCIFGLGLLESVFGAFFLVFFFGILFLRRQPVMFQLASIFVWSVFLAVVSTTSVTVIASCFVLGSIFFEFDFFKRLRLISRAVMLAATASGVVLAFFGSLTTSLGSMCYLIFVVLGSMLLQYVPRLKTRRHTQVLGIES